MSFNLVKLTDEYMTRKRISFPRQAHLRPSEASVVWVDEHGIKRTAGSCLRQSYYRLTGVSGMDTDAYSEWVFALGKAVEVILVEQWKQMGIWVDNNLKFYWPEYNISGEVDCILRDPTTAELVLVECKSMYGYNAHRDICGNTKQAGKPKTSQMLQLCIYLKFLKEFFSYGKLVYYSRDDAHRAEFDIRLKEESPNCTRIYINDTPDKRFYVENILNRYTELNQYLSMNAVPAADYEWQYSDEKIEKLYEIEEIGKTKYQDWKKGKEIIGDWQCRWCQYHPICWGE